MERHQTRTTVPFSGSFMSIPSAFGNADDGVKNVVKLGFRTTLSQNTKEEIKIEVSTDVLLLDFGAIKPEMIDSKKIIRDCELVKEALSKHPNALSEIVKELQTGTADGIEKANKIAQQSSLTEENALNAGGGFIFLLILGAAILAGGCGGALKEKATSPGASTTPGK